MTPTQSTLPAPASTDFKLPAPRDLAFICASALMPYLLACVLLAF